VDDLARRRREQDPRGDPRWALTDRPALTPAMTFLLMTGEPADVRLPGWARTSQAGTGDAPEPACVWWWHAGTLTAEARAHGFEAFWLTQRLPEGAGFDAWRAAFLATHRY
jgi:hypothetical protein